MDVVANVIVPTPISKPRVPDRWSLKLPIPGGMSWVMFSVKFPLRGGPKTPGGSVDVTKNLPNETPAGVPTEIGGAPLKASVVVPVPSIKVTTLVPDVLNTPEELNVTGAARASVALNPSTIARRMIPTEALFIGTLLDTRPKKQFAYRFWQGRGARNPVTRTTCLLCRIHRQTGSNGDS
jgi:hypothetical protein